MSNQARIKLVETPEEMDAVKALRMEVFVHEQKVPLDEEFDEHDGEAIHAIAMLDGRVVGTGRVYRNSSGETQIGRMAVERGYRRRGIGGLILAFLEGQARRNGVDRVMLHAQTYVRSFYERHGYVAEGEPFMEVEIEHVKMVKRLE